MLSAPLDRCRLYGWLTDSTDDGTDFLDGGSQRILKEMRVSSGGRRVRVPEQGANQRQAGASTGQLTRERMSEIVDAQALDACGLADRLPRRSKLDNDRRGCDRSGRPKGQEPAVRVFQIAAGGQEPTTGRHDRISARCCCRAWSRYPWSSRYRPARRHGLETPAAGEQEQPDDVGRLLVRIGSQRRRQPRQLIAGQVAFALFLVIVLDALHGIDVVGPACS
jgi:hypothetical protein